MDNQEQIVAPAPAPEPSIEPQAEQAMEAKKEVKKSKKRIILLIILMLGILGAVGGTIAAILLLNQPQETAQENSPSPADDEPHTSIISQDVEKVKYYSPLTGLEVDSEEDTTKPTFCVQVPNGTDGARPQAGLDHAGVIFEAIAEAGITRFAAIFQGVENISAIGPMRSLRLYYLQWDAPFDCTIVHDGGADDAIAAARSYKDFTNFGKYVWRSTKNSKVNRRWNNEFTSGELLLQYNSDRGFSATSDVRGFSRLTPEASLKAKVDNLAPKKLDIDTPTTERTSVITPKVTKVVLRFGNMNNYNPSYIYNASTNTYQRGYTSGNLHTIYNCDGQSGKITPETTCEETQLTPSVVVAIRVQQATAADKYHQVITTVGSGAAYIFQNGDVIEGTWKKTSVGDQIRFYDQSGKEILLAPGQTIVSAIPPAGSISWE